MSRLSPEDLGLPAGAVELDTRAMEFIIDRTSPGWSDTDEAELSAWLAQSVAHQAAFWRLASIWDRADRLTALRPIPPRTELRQPSVSRRSIYLRAVAAFFLIALVGAGAFYSRTDTSSHEYSTPLGGHELVKLSDGSSVELNTDTFLRASISADHRTVELVRGEALFRVKHDTRRPFVVSAVNHRITDLGTSFLVRETNDRLKVALLEGRARLESESAQGKIKRVAILMPGDEANATPQSMLVSRKSIPDLETEAAWREGMLIFHRVSIAYAAAELNRYNQKKIVVADVAAGARVFSATLKTNDPVAFARMAHDFLGLRAQEVESEIVISR
jgi:transmembrane sensor